MFSPHDTRALATAALGAGLVLAGIGRGAAAEPVTLSGSIRSEILGEDVSLAITLPVSYDRADARYPVLYILEDDLYRRAMTGTVETWSRLGLMPAMIVVGVATTDRWRDFTPTRAGVPGGEVIPASGGAAEHQAFLSSELVPYVERNFRCQPFRVLFGHSIAGLHAITVMLTDPDLFGACIATSPSLWWDDEVAIGQAKTSLEAQPRRRGCLYLATGNENETMQAPVRRFRDLLVAQAPPGLRWMLESYPDAGHSVLPVKACPGALDFVFVGWPLPDSTLAAGLAAVDAHYEALSTRFGYPINAPEPVMNRLGYRALRTGDFAEAVTILRRNAAAYPLSANVHDSLGEAYLAQGDTAHAIAEYARALALDPTSEGARTVLEQLGAPEAAATLVLPPTPWETEARELHAFFRGWYRGDIADTDEQFARMAGVLADDFSLITSGGSALTRATMLPMMRGEHGTKPGLEMTTGAFRLRAMAGDLILFTYEERTVAGGREKATLVSAVVRRVPDTPNGLEWVHVHEVLLAAGKP